MPVERGPYRVLHLTSAHPALDGRIFHKECRSLARAGYDVMQVGLYDLNTTIDGVRVRGLGVGSGRAGRVTNGLVALLVQALRSGGDVFHIHDPDLLLVGLVLRVMGKRVIYDIHEDLPTKILLKMYLPRVSRRPMRWLVERLENLAARLMSGLITATPALKERFCRLNPRTVVVNNFPYLGDFSQQIAGPWQERDRAVIYYGGISEARGIEEMLTAVSLLPEELGIRFDLAGWFYVQPLLDILKTRPGWKSVSWHGALDRSELNPLLNKARVGLVILRPEESFLTSQPTKLFEYMAAGIPVIASDFPLWRSIIESAGCGILVDPADTVGIARAIERLVSDTPEAQAMGHRGRIAVEAHYNWGKEERALLSFYSMLLSDGRYTAQGREAENDPAMLLSPPEASFSSIKRGRQVFRSVPTESKGA